jgi:hypothetical protein
MTAAEDISTRYELKQAYSDLLLPELRSWVEMHPAGFRIAYPSRWVNSIYFDTHGLDTFNDHIAGVPVRRKLRYRWYGQNLRIAQGGQVEVKNKSEYAGWKLIEKLAPTFVLDDNHWAKLMDEYRAAASGVIKELLSVCRPVLLTVYRREYYVSANGQVRLTIDSQLRGYDQYLASRPNLSFCHPSDGQAILELKSEVSQADELAEVLSHFPVRASRYSKYVNNIWWDLV